MLIEQQISERRERAENAIARILTRPDGQPFGDYQVKSTSGKTYRVALRGAGLFENFCSCPDFAVNTLGTCKHIEALLIKVRRRRGPALERGRFKRHRASLSLQYGERLEVRLRLPESPSAGLLALAAEHFDAAGLLRPESIVVSLAPRLTLAWLTARLGEHARVARVLPNAPSIVGSGYNPVVFGPALSAGERERVLSLFRPLGACPEVPEETVEAYALLVAMGPTYLWFQLEELRRLGREFGLAPAELDRALPAMVEGAVRTLFGSGLDRDEVLDLVPVRPLAADEESIRALYADRLPPLFERLTAGR